MKCESCGKNPATVHYTAYENNQPREMHVCQQCAVEKGIVIVLSDKEKFSIQDPIISMFSDLAGQEARVGRIQCPSCGQLYSGFRETGRLGCARCYETFSVQLKPLLRRIHGNVNHTGKAPSGDTGQVERRTLLQRLQEELEMAVSRENFEKAAELRDRIRQLHGQEEGSAEEGKGEPEP